MKSSRCFIFSLVTGLLMNGGVQAAKVQENASLFIMPPKYDYSAICKAQASRFHPDEVERLRTHALPELAPDALLRLAEAYSENDDVIAADYPFVLEVIDRITQLPYRGENQSFIDDALFIKYDIFYKGKAGEVKSSEAKAILDTLIARNHAKAHRRYGEMYLAHTPAGDPAHQRLQSLMQEKVYSEMPLIDEFAGGNATCFWGAP